MARRPKTFSTMTSFSFSVGGYAQGYKTMVIERTDDGWQARLPGLDTDITLQVSDEALSDLKSVLDSVHLLTWKKYMDPDILDGTQWEIEVGFENGSHFETYGSNLWPVGFSEVYAHLCCIGLSGDPDGFNDEWSIARTVPIDYRSEFRY